MSGQKSSSPSEKTVLVTSPHTLPPPVLRLLSLSSPLINGLHSFIHLATWTKPHGGGTRSCLLLIVWTLACLYAYPILRYAPQVPLFAVILGSAVPNVLSPNTGSLRRRSSAKRIASMNAHTLTQAQIDEHLQKLSDILDVSSTLHADLILPAWQALTWQHPAGPQTTIGVAGMVLVFGTLWTLCFSDWPDAWSRSVAHLPLVPLWSRLVIGLRYMIFWIKQNLYDAYLKEIIEEKLLIFSALVTMESHLQNAIVPVHLYLSGFKFWLPQSLPFTYLPPFPLFSLSLRHAAVFFGLIVLSWCSTFATLVRHALWKSASIRKSFRTVLRTTSLGYFGGPEAARLYAHAIDEEISPQLQMHRVDGTIGQLKRKNHSATPQARVDIVLYRFELYENQRWWMGLDWTAALLPQERPSWTDSFLAPVSPPTSFTLPSESIQWRPKPTKANPNAWEKRIVRWRWEEDEWHVVVNLGGGLPPGARESSIKKCSRGAREGISADGASSRSPSTLFSGFASRDGQAAPPCPSKKTDLLRADERSSTAFSRSTGAVEEDFAEDFAQETDSSGWRYGDNGWEKMTNRSGIGKYTRRRKWVRKARMEEIVLDDQERTAEESVLKAAVTVPSQQLSQDEEAAIALQNQTNRKEESGHGLDAVLHAGNQSTGEAKDKGSILTDHAPDRTGQLSTSPSALSSTKVNLKTRLVNVAASP